VNCIVTAGPTYEPLDEVRRLTNFSTGRLGCELAQHLSDRGHRVILLKAVSAVYQKETRAERVVPFTTTADLGQKLRALAQPAIHAVFHAAAVSDFGFGRIFRRWPSGNLEPTTGRKLPTNQDALLAELVPTPKVIAELRSSYPEARLIGWKYEVEGTREAALSEGASQIRRCRTDACVVNGPAYGDGFGVMRLAAGCVHVASRPALFELLESIGAQS
jgi:phosphopantothenate---cysteine ligase (CTP)